MEHRLQPLQSIELTIYAKDRYSVDHLLINRFEEYQFYCDPSQIWKDWFIKTSPDGFYNPLAALVSLRVKTANCFCLCGSYNNDEQRLFKIGSGVTLLTDHDGYISLFANDAFNYYKNNKGSVMVKITRR